MNCCLHIIIWCNTWCFHQRGDSGNRAYDDHDVIEVTSTTHDRNTVQERSIGHTHMFCIQTNNVMFTWHYDMNTHARLCGAFLSEHDVSTTYPWLWRRTTLKLTGGVVIMISIYYNHKWKCKTLQGVPEWAQCVGMCARASYSGHWTNSYIEYRVTE